MTDFDTKPVLLGIMEMLSLDGHRTKIAVSTSPVVSTRRTEYVAVRRSRKLLYQLRTAIAKHNHGFASDLWSLPQAPISIWVEVKDSVLQASIKTPTYEFITIPLDDPDSLSKIRMLVAEKSAVVLRAARGSHGRYRSDLAPISLNPMPAIF